MARVLETYGHSVVPTDIADCGFGTSGIDFLASRAMCDGCRTITTNPPYGEAALDGRAAYRGSGADASDPVVRHVRADQRGSPHREYAFLASPTQPLAPRSRRPSGKILSAEDCPHSASG